MRLLLIRHGQTPSNVAGALDTAIPGAELTALGYAQAAAVPAALADEDLSAIYASRLIRTQLTAAPLARARRLEISVREGLEEISAGELEMRHDQAARHGYADCLAAWMSGNLSRTMPGGVDGHAFWAAYDTSIRGIVADHRPDETVAVFTHGAAVRVFTALAARLPPEVAVELSIANTGMSVLEGGRESDWELRTWLNEPLGGPELVDRGAHDVTGESVEEAESEGDDR